MSPMPTTGVIVVDHGSRLPDANEFLVPVIDALRAGGHAIVEAAHLEIATPGIAAAFESCVTQGAEHIVVCPFFLLPGRHVTEDIPAQVAVCAADHDVTAVITEPVGVHPEIAEVVAALVETEL